MNYDRLVCWQHLIDYMSFLVFASAVGNGLSPFIFVSFFSHELDIDENPCAELDDNGALLGFKHGSGQK